MTNQIDMDNARAFLDSRVRVTGDPRDRVFARDLGDAYCCWLFENNMPAVGLTKACRDIRQASIDYSAPETGRRFRPMKSCGLQQYVGIILEPS